MKIRRINKTHKVQREEAEGKQLDRHNWPTPRFVKTARFKDKNVKKKKKQTNATGLRVDKSTKQLPLNYSFTLHHRDPSHHHRSDCWGSTPREDREEDGQRLKVERCSEG